ncbi:MAG: hypothetical protein R2733_09195 [Acidimicrobiales bacterium]
MTDNDDPSDLTLMRTASMRVGLPAGWEAEIDNGSGEAEAGTVVATPRAHIANFALPPNRGDFGSGAVERMQAGDVLICLLEEDPAVIGSRLFDHAGLPSVTAEDFSPTGMQRPIRGQSGAQKFFHVNARAFALYVVVGSHLSRASFIDEINQVIAAIDVS